MTGVEFHFNAPDKVGYTCRLLRKAVGKGAKVVVTGDPGLLRELDVALWTFSPLEFVPHCYGEASGAAVLAASPVVLSQAAHAAPHHEVLVNLGPGVAEGFERFERLIEVVTLDDDDRVLGRRRWKHYADRGYAIMKHDRSEEAA